MFGGIEILNPFFVYQLDAGKEERRPRASGTEVVKGVEVVCKQYVIAVGAVSESIRDRCDEPVCSFCQEWL